MDRREMMRLTLGGAAFVPLSTSTGCATLMDLFGKYVKMPQLALRDMKVMGMTLSSLQVRFLAQLKNPNPFGFRLDGLDWLIKLAGKDTAKGRSPKGIELKPRGSSETQLDVDFDLGKTAQTILSLIGKQSVPYEIQAVGHLRARQYKFDVPAKLAGKMPMPRLPSFDVPKFSVASANASGITFRVDTLVNNPNAFRIPIDAFTCDIKVGGREVLRNRTVRNLKLDAKQKEKVPLEFTVDLVDLGLTAARLAQNPRMNWEVAAELASGALKVPFTQRGQVTL